MFAKDLPAGRAKVARDPNAKTYTDDALTELTDDYDRSKCIQLSDAARAAGAKAKRIEERRHHAPRRRRRTRRSDTKDLALRSLAKRRISKGVPG